MKTANKDTLIKIIVFLLGAALMFAWWYDPYNDFQADSERFAVGSLVHGAREDGFTEYGLVDALETTTYNKLVIDVMREYYGLQEVEYQLYRSQVGLQGYCYQLLGQLFCGDGFVPRIVLLYNIIVGMCCALMALVAMGIAYGVGKKYNNKLAIAFFLTFLLSQWVKDFSVNIYWVEFTWYVPMLLGVIMSLDYKKFNKLWFYSLVFLAVGIKSACGYEYITTVMLGLILFPLVDLFTVDKSERKMVFAVIFKLGIAALAGFFAAIAVHALMRGGGNLIAGIKDIYVRDVLRTTVGKNTVNASSGIFDAAIFYLTFHTPVIEGVPETMFAPLALFSFVIFVFSAHRAESRWELVLYFFSALCTLSWYVLGKSHSLIHTYMNYGLWYFGFVQMLIYALVSVASKAVEGMDGKGSV